MDDCKQILKEFQNGSLTHDLVNWMPVRFILAVAKIHNLDTKVIDFVLAFPQAKLDDDVFMEIPAGMVLSGPPGSFHRGTYALKLNKSLYWLKQASANWFSKTGFIQTWIHVFSFQTKLFF